MSDLRLPHLERLRLFVQAAPYMALAPALALVGWTPRIELYERAFLLHGGFRRKIGADGRIFAKREKYDLLDRIALLQLAGLGTRNDRPPWSFIDIGANIGFYTRWASYEGAASIVAIEPAPSNIELLKANIELSDSNSRIQVYQCAAGNAEGAAALHEQSDAGSTFVQNPGKASLTPTETPVLSTTMKRVDAIIAATQPHEDRLVIKIDIEGNEPMAIQGMSSTLLEHRPIVQTEWLHHSRVDPGERKRVIELLSSADYTFVRRKSPRSRSIEAIDSAKVIYTEHDTLYLLPNERLKDFYSDVP